MDGTRFIVAGSFIDGSGADARRNVFLAVKYGIIDVIGSAEDLPCNDGPHSAAQRRKKGGGGGQRPTADRGED